MGVAKRDANRVPTLIGVSSDDGVTPILVEVDPVTNRLYVDASITVGFGSQTGVVDGEVVEAADTGTLILGTDGTNYQVLSTDSSGNLQVEVLTAPTTAVTGTFWQTTQPVSIASMPSTPVTGTFWQTTQPVSIASLPTGAVTNAGTFAVQSTLQAGTAEVGSLLPPDTDVTVHTNYARKYYTSATPTDGIIWSPAAGKRWHVVTMYIQVSAASTVTLEDDKAGGDDPVWKGEIAANSGVVLSFTEQYPMASGEDAADLTITATAGTVYVTCVGYEV